MRMSFLGIFLLFGSAAAIAAVVLFVCGIKETLIKSIQTTLSNEFSCGRIDGNPFNQRIPIFFCPYDALFAAFIIFSANIP